MDVAIFIILFFLFLIKIYEAFLKKKPAPKLDPSFFISYPLEKMVADFNYEINRLFYIRFHGIFNERGSDGRENPSAVRLLVDLVDDEEQKTLSRLVLYIRSHIPGAFLEMLKLAGWRDDVIIEHITLGVLSFARQLIMKLSIDLKDASAFEDKLTLLVEERFLFFTHMGLMLKTDDRRNK